MTMNSSGAISLGGAVTGQSINLENGQSATAQVSLNDTAVRNLAGVASGAITMPTNFYGKSNVVNISYTYSANTANASLNLSSISGYSAGKSNITVTINAGVYLYATSTGGYGLTITGGTTGDTLTIVNNGYIMGMGGGGGTSNNLSGIWTNGSAGGTALNLGFGMSSCTITNTSGYITGGGGGGGASGYGGANSSGGGGAGGGAGGNIVISTGATVSGGSGGSIGASGGNGTNNSGGGSGGGGGRVVLGTGGSGGWYLASGVATGGGSGGGGGNSGYVVKGSAYTANSGGGGGWGASGGASKSGASSGDARGGAGGSAGSAGSAGTEGSADKSGGAGGKGVNLNAKSITWTGGSASSSRVYGAVS